MSSAEQVAGTSLDTQADAIAAFAQREGYRLARTFREEGESAKTADRTRLRELLQYCHGHRVDLVLVWKYDRFARSLEDHVQLRSELRALGVDVRSVTEPVTEDPAGRLMENVFAAFAQFDNEVRAQRTRAGMLAVAQSGRWPWRAPRGYLQGRSGMLEHDPERAPVIRAAFERVADGLGNANAVRLDMKRAGVSIPKQSFSRMLRLPIYAGRIVIPRWGVDTPAAFPGIVDADTFADVAAAIAGRGPRPSRRIATDAAFPLRRFAYCGACGTPLTGSTSRGRSARYSYYHCRTCPRSSVPVDRLHARFSRRLDGLSLDARLLPLFRDQVATLARDAAAGARSRRQSVANRLAALDQREKQLREAYIFRGGLAPDVYAQEQARIDAQRATLQAEAAALSGADDLERTLSGCERVLTQLGESWNRAEGQQRRRLQRIIYPEGVPILRGTVGTAATADVFRLFRPFEGSEYQVVAPAAPSWNRIAGQLRALAACGGAR